MHLTDKYTHAQSGNIANVVKWVNMHDELLLIVLPILQEHLCSYIAHIKARPQESPFDPLQLLSQIHKCAWQQKDAPYSL